MRAALADQDLARVDDLAAEPLHAKALGVRVTSVPAGRGALLVCHFSVTSQAFFSAVLALAVLALAVLALAVLALAVLALPVAMPVIFTCVYFWR